MPCISGGIKQELCVLSTQHRFKPPIDTKVRTVAIVRLYCIMGKPPTMPCELTREHCYECTAVQPSQWTSVVEHFFVFKILVAAK